MILIVGVGALGTVVAQQLKDMPLTLQDYDIVQAVNSLFTAADIGRQKAAVAAERLGCTAVTTPFDTDTSLDGVACVVDCSDNMGTKLLVSDKARGAGIPCVTGAAARDRGMAFRSGDACWRCVAHGKTPVDDCEAGIEPDVARAVGVLLARLVREPEEGLHLVTGDCVRRIAVTRNPTCPACKGEVTEEPFTVAFCPGTRKMQARPNRPMKMDLAAVPGEVLARYPSATKVRLDTGEALVHAHGLIEFERVPAVAARAFARACLCVDDLFPELDLERGDRA